MLHPECAFEGPILLESGLCKHDKGNEMRNLEVDVVVGHQLARDCGLQHKRGCIRCYLQHPNRFNHQPVFTSQIAKHWLPSLQGSLRDMLGSSELSTSVSRV